MAITTYTELLTAAANWLGRSDLTSRIPEFVTLAQNKINRRVKATAMETKTTSITISAQYVSVPTDYLEAKEFYVTSSSPNYQLEYMPPDSMTAIFGSNTGKPRYFAPTGGQFRFGPTPDGSYTATLVYFAKPATLATTTQETNSLFPNNADLYLYGTLVEAEAFVQDDARIGVWKQGFEEAVKQINDQSTRTRWGGNAMAVRVG